MSEKNIKVTWLDINSSYSHSSLAFPAIEVQRAGDNTIEWSKVSGTINSVANNIVGELLDKKPDVIAYTAWLFTHDMILKILSRYKKLVPDVVIIGGGPEYLGDNRDYMFTNPFIDVVARGEGEELFYEWLSAEKSQWHTIKGLCYIDNGQYMDNGIAKVEHYERLKFPEDSLFFDWDKPFIQIESTRGCFNSCAFCVSGADKPVRSLSIEVLRRRLKKAQDNNIKDIRLLDRTFNGVGSRAVELLSLFEEFAGTMQFHLEVHPALFVPKIREKIMTLPKGLLHIEAGVQSLNQVVLDKAQRFGKVEDVIDGLKFLCDNDCFEVHSDLIAGLPDYTLPMIYEDVNRLSMIGCGEIQLELLKLLPGTIMRDRAYDYGIIYSPVPPYEVMQTSSINYFELQESRRLSRMLDMYYNCEVWQSVIRELIAVDMNFVLNFTRHLTSLDMIDTPLSMERRGIILFDYCKSYYADYLVSVTVCWIMGGLSLKKGAGEGAVSYTGLIPNDIIEQIGEIGSSVRLYTITVYDSVVWFGFDRSKSHSKPVFCFVEKFNPFYHKQ